MTTYYVYAYDVYGARTYFTVSSVPKYAQLDRRELERYLSRLSAKKLHVSIQNVRLGDYSKEPFDQGHLPTNVYRKGKWVSHTTDD